MLLPGTSRIYHGGGPGGGGWPNSDLDGKYLIDRLWVPANEIEPHPSNPCGVAATYTLPAGSVATRALSYATNQLEICFVWVKPPLYWNYDITAPTGLNVKIHWYVTTTNFINNGVRWGASCSIVRNGETLNFVPPAMNYWLDTSGTAYDLHIKEYNDFPIFDPAGSGTSVEPLLYFKFERDGLHATDTYPENSYVLGFSFDFPMVFP